MFVRAFTIFQPVRVTLVSLSLRNSTNSKVGSVGSGSSLLQVALLILIPAAAAVAVAAVGFTVRVLVPVADAVEVCVAVAPVIGIRVAVAPVAELDVGVRVAVAPVVVGFRVAVAVVVPILVVGTGDLVAVENAVAPAVLVSVGIAEVSSRGTST